MAAASLEDKYFPSSIMTETHPVPPPSLAFIVSLPRSGSTVLTSLLDQAKGVICHPESSFPQIYGKLAAEIRSNPDRLADYYIASTFAGTPLTHAEARSCMTGELEEILEQLGIALGRKTGRPVDQIKSIIWKTTRTVAMCEAPLKTSGRFVVLRRHPYNVYESQFRVGFGINNRNPFRFAFFRESYECAFAKIPTSRRIDIEYDDLPGVVPDLLEFLRVEANAKWEDGFSSLEAVAHNRPWLSEINKEFSNTDGEKRQRLSPSQRRMLDGGLALARVLRPALLPLRNHYDLCSFRTIETKATEPPRA